MFYMILSPKLGEINMVYVRVSFDEIKKMQSRTDPDIFINLSEADINRSSLSDPDIPNLTEDELKEFQTLPKCSSIFFK